MPEGREPKENPVFTGPHIEEVGATVDGVPETLDERAFYQLHVFTGAGNVEEAVAAVKASGLEAVVYADVSDPSGLGVLLITEDPALFAGEARKLLSGAPFDGMRRLPEFTMTGRTYAAGREKNLKDWLLYRMRRYALNPANIWAVWYPLRRSGAFNRLPRQEQARMMAEHAMIGRAYGESGHAFDIRLECHGLDRADNEFVLGIVGPKLAPLSKLIKDMRPTRQTSEYIESMGPFFIGKVVYQAPLPEKARPSGSGH